MISKSAHDPRTIARDIPGVFEALFPHLAQGVVAGINRKSKSIQQLQAVPSEIVDASNLQKAMLFEVAIAAAEQLIGGSEVIDWIVCLEVAVKRQKQHFDAKIPQS